MTASRMIIRTCSALSIANSGAPFDSTCSARTSSPDDIRYQRIIRFTKFRDATRAAAFSGCPRNLVLSSGPIAARTSRRSFIFAPQPTVTLSRPCQRKSQKTQERGSRWSLRTDEGGTGSKRATSGLLRRQTRLMPASAARPGHQLYPGGGQHRRPAEAEPSFRPSPRPIPSPGGSRAPAGRSGAPPEARKAPKSKIGLPRPLLKWEAWGARCRFRPLETVGTASNMPVMA